MNRGVYLLLVLAFLAWGRCAEARYLGTCVSLLTQDGAVSRVESAQPGPSTHPDLSLSLAEAQAALERYSLQAEVRESVLEITPDGNPASNPLARAAYILRNDAAYRSSQFPNGFKLIVDPALQSTDGSFSLETGEIRLAASALADHVLAFSTVAREMSRAEQLSLWLNARSQVAGINTTARGQLPGLENTRFGKQVSAQEMPALAVGKHIFEQYQGSTDPVALAAGRKIAKSFYTMASEILSVIDGLSPKRRETIYFTNFHTSQRNGETLMVEYHVGTYSNLKTQKYFATIKVLKRSYQGMREYRLELPLPTETTSMSAGDYLDLVLTQVRGLQSASQKYLEVFK